MAKTKESSIKSKLKELSEYQEQVLIFEWAERMSNKYPELKLLNASLNGVRLNIGQAVKCKKSGMKKGYPDIFLPIRTVKMIPSIFNVNDTEVKLYSGLFIELKKTNGKNSDVKADQKIWNNLLREQGFQSLVCFGHKEVIQEICSYLGVKNEIR